MTTPPPEPPRSDEAAEPRAPRDIRAILCDVDGCLSPEAIGQASASALATVAKHNHRARTEGDRPLLTLCTGRPLPFADAIARMVGALDLPIVCEAGAFLFEPKTYTWEIDQSLTPEYFAALAEQRSWVERTFPSVYFEQGKSASLTLFHPEGPEALERDVLRRLQDRVAERSLPFRIAMTWTCINVEPASVSKATGIERFMRRTGLATHQLAGIGDTMSDMAIRERVRFFACPANAKPELKPHADYVSAFDEVFGVLDILEHMLGDPSIVTPRRD